MNTACLPDPKSLLEEGSREQQMANFKSAVLSSIKEAATLVSQRATAEEANAYKAMLVSVAGETPQASKEGGFLSFGGERVSSVEQSFLNEVKTQLDMV